MTGSLGCPDRAVSTDSATGETGASSSATGSGPPTSSATADSGETTATGATTSVTTSSTTGAAAGCVCTAFAGEKDCGDDNFWMHVPDCDLDTICPTLTVQCARPNDDLYFCQNELVFDGEALACILEAMRDRTPGRFIVEGYSDDGLFGDASVYGVRLTGDAGAVLSTCKVGDTGVGWGGKARILAPPVFFADCLAELDPRVRHGCILAGMLEPAALPACSGE